MAIVHDSLMLRFRRVSTNALIVCDFGFQETQYIDDDSIKLRRVASRWWRLSREENGGQRVASFL